MSDQRFETCVKHGVRRCLICNRPAAQSLNTKQQTSKDILPTVPDFPQADTDSDKMMEPIFHPQPPFELPAGAPKDPLVVAAEEYSAACRHHMASQSEVAR